MANENLHSTTDLELKPPHVTTWDRKTSGSFDWPYFFDEIGDVLTYAKMLEVWLTTKLREVDFWKVLRSRTVQHLHISSSQWMVFGKEISLAVGVTVVQQHLPRHYSGHHVLPNVSHRTRTWGDMIKGQVVAHRCGN